MIRIEPTNDTELLNSLSKKIFGKEFDGKVGFVLYYKEEAAGIAALKINEEEATIKYIGIVPELRCMGLGDFFTRSLMNNLSYVTKTIKAGYVSPYYEKFGFRRQGGEMIIESKDIVFPSKCKHN